MLATVERKVERTEALLKHHGWEIECISPLEIRHAGRGDFASGLAAHMVISGLEPLEQSPLQAYQDSDTAPPPTAPWPFEKEQFEPFLGTGTLVTFTALVPLEVLVNGGGIDGLNDYCQEAFGAGVEISSTEYRAVSSDTSSDDWDERLSGDVAVQVTCTIDTVE